MAHIIPLPTATGLVVSAGTPPKPQPRRAPSIALPVSTLRRPSSSPQHRAWCTRTTMA
ncbi:hypothetical protein C8R44DRAFT_786933 [Mycena epipterygia]|nr:hypothetical protein C8R44DRAFT_786933 [Mycena epipterygia]